MEIHQLNDLNVVIFPSKIDGAQCCVVGVFLLLEDRVDVLGSTPTMSSPMTSEQGYKYHRFLINVTDWGTTSQLPF